MPKHLMLMSREASTPLLMTLWMKMTHDSLGEDASRQVMACQASVKGIADRI